MTNTAKEFPDFFKVFLTEKHSQRMLIPKAFVSLMLSKQRVLRNFILRDHRGRNWHVKVRPIGDKLYFDDGWKRFKDENSLEENDFLFFTHVENNVFKFKIFELSTMCEKMEVIDEEESSNNLMENEEKDDDNDNDDDDDDDDDDEGDDKYIKIEEENEEMYKKINKSENQHCRTCKNWDIIGSSYAGSKLEDDEIDAEMYIQPGNPHFIVKHLHTRPNELHIPKNVIKDFCLCFTKYINLVFCDCKDIQSNEIASYHHILPQMSTYHTVIRGKMRTWRDGRVVVLRWEDFCRQSKITEHDTCLCEIVLRDNEAIEMLRVHVVRKE